MTNVNNLLPLPESTELTKASDAERVREALWAKRSMVISPDLRDAIEATIELPLDDMLYMCTYLNQ